MTNHLVKWTPDQDQLLREGVKKYGIKWQLVKTYMKHIRSINSIIKRWHGKLKHEIPTESTRQSAGRSGKNVNEVQGGGKEKEAMALEGDNQEDLLTWKKGWTERDDKKLKLLIVQSGIMNWDLLSEALEASPDEIKLRWKKVIYPGMISNASKVGGSIKWSILEDKILNVGFKQGINWQSEGKILLPFRTYGSIQARWRRVAKNFEVKATMQNKYLARKECLKRIALARRLAQEAIEQEVRSPQVQPE